MHRRPGANTVVVGLVALLTAVTGLVGCGGDDEAAPEVCVQVDPVDGVTELTVVGKNLAFDVECFEIQPSQVRFTFVNEDKGVSHNLHVTGEGVNERTALERGEITQVLELEITEPGRYDFVCDPHGTMEGSLVVVDPDAPPSTTAT